MESESGIISQVICSGGGGALYLATEGGLVEGRSLPCAHIDVVAPRQQQLHYFPARRPGRDRGGTTGNTDTGEREW